MLYFFKLNIGFLMGRGPRPRPIKKTPGATLFKKYKPKKILKTMKKMFRPQSKIIK